MSGEFREARGYHLWDVLESLHERGDHPVSQALYDLYQVLLPIEKGCAWCEAFDSGPDYPATELVKAMSKIEEAIKRLKTLSNEYEAIIRSAIYEYESKKEEEKNDSNSRKMS